MAIKGLSVRAKLTLATVAVLAVVYMLLGVTVQIAASQAIHSSIDASLHRDGERLLRMWSHPPPGPGDRGGPPGGFNGPPPDRGGRPGDFGGPGPGPAPDDRGPGPGHGGPRGPEGRIPPFLRHLDLPGPGEGQFPPIAIWRRSDFDIPIADQKNAYDLESLGEALEGRQRMSTVVWNDQPIRVLTVGLPTRGPGGGYDAVVQFAYPLAGVNKTLGSLASTLFILLPIGLASVAVASLLIVGWAISPVREISRTTARIEAESLAGRLSVRGRDEFAELAETINGMLGRLDGAFSAQRATLEQLKTIVEQQRLFTADASHELKTPLSVIKVHAGLLRRKCADPAEVTESAEAIDAAADRMAALVRDLLLLARTDAGQLSEGFQLCDMNEVADQAVSSVPGSCRVKMKRSDGPLTVCGSASGLERVFINLLDNACRHSEPGQPVILELRREGSEAVAEVRDSGEGIPAEHLPKIFDRFYRIDSSRHSETGGAGLGLAICKGIVEAHGGSISAASQVGTGSSFSVRIPLGRSV